MFKKIPIMNKIGLVTAALALLSVSFYPNAAIQEGAQASLPAGVPRITPEDKNQVIPESILDDLPESMPLIKPEATSQKISPAKHVIGEISYISGGIGKDEAAEMRAMAKDYPLEVVCVQKAEDKENYIADVKVYLTDAKGKVVLDIVTNGPILLVDLPKGMYTIIAQYNDIIKTDQLRVDPKKHQRVVFLWPI